MSSKTLDELQWSDPAAAEEMQGIHSNSVLFYFMRSPYFDQTSNNNTVYNQALHNASMFPILETRDRFEDFLRGMSGVEYVVHQAPAEMAPGTGTGVWVIRKQLRRKRSDGQPDDLTVYADYFVVGYNVYQAPTLGDILSSRITSMAVSLSKAFPAMDSMQSWSPARGHIYEMPDDDVSDEYDDDDDEEDDDDDDDDEDEDEKMADTATTSDEAASSVKSPLESSTTLDPRVAEESYAIHIMFGGEYMDEQPVSGRPGEFHLSAASRKNANAAAASGGTAAGVSGLHADGSDGKTAGANATKKTSPLAGGGSGSGKDGKEGKSSKSGGPSKPKRRKSKIGSGSS